MRAIGEPAVGREFDDVGEARARCRRRRPKGRGRADPACRSRSPRRATPRVRARSWCAGLCRRRARARLSTPTCRAPKAFVSVDLPAPDGPIIATVCPGTQIGLERVEAFARRRTHRVDVDADRVGACCLDALVDLVWPSMSPSRARSTLVSRTTGVAPDCHASARAALQQPRPQPADSGTTMKTVSMLAATTCGDRLAGRCSSRANIERRSNTATAVSPSSATQSPTAGCRPSSDRRESNAARRAKTHRRAREHGQRAAADASHREPASSVEPHGERATIDARNARQASSGLAELQKFKASSSRASRVVKRSQRV